MRVCIDIEANSRTKPNKIWCIVLKDIDTNEFHIFRNLLENEEDRKRFIEYSKGVKLWIGHNILGYDCPVLHDLINFSIDVERVADTLVLSKLVNYSRVQKHSLESYGIEFGKPKGKNHSLDFFKTWTQELEDYCVRDVEISHEIFNTFSSIFYDPSWSDAIRLEQRFQLIVNDLHDNGFAFDVAGGTKLLATVTELLKGLDDKILAAFPPKEVLIREFTPKLTKFGTISRTSVPRSLHADIHKYEGGKTYKHTRLEPFNPSSHKQLISVLNEAGWKPEDKTETHKDVERELNQLKRKSTVPQELTDKLKKLKVSGWKINEINLGTLPPSAPEPARLLAKRILLESRRRTLTEWLGLVQDDGRIHGKFYGIGAWTHRMAHQKPNTANIPNSVKISDGSERLLGKELRQLWIAPKNRLLVGVDAEAIQFRIFAHMIDDPGLFNAIVNGKKSDKTDPHSVNQIAFGSMCKTRNASKHSMFALFFGGRANKISQIMGCTKGEAEEAIQNLMKKYPGLARLEKTVFPNDARLGYFVGIDGRKVPIPDVTLSGRKHLCMSGYLQNGEKIIMAKAAILIDDRLQEEKALKKWMFVAIVHDALDSEVRNSRDFALKIAAIKAEAIAEAGRIYKLKCPMAGSYFNDDTKKYTIGTNWYATH